MENTHLVLFFTDGVSLQTWKKVGNFERELALYKSLQAEGICLDFVTYGDKRDLEISKEVDVRVQCNSMALPKEWYRLALEWFPPKGDIYKSNQISGATTAMKAASRNSAKFVARCGYLLSENQADKYGPNSDWAIAARAEENQVFNGADRVVVTTERMSDVIVTAYGIPKPKIRVIPNYVETERFKPRKRRRGDKFRIGYVGRLESEKNLISLLKAVGPLKVEMLLVGDGSQRSVLMDAGSEFTAKMEFLGNLPNRDIPEFLSGCDLFVLPSLYEGHPKALLEAMACGLPVLGTKVRGIQEMVRDGKNGLLSDTNFEDIRKKIVLLMEKPDLRKKLAESARSYVVDNFSLERIVDLETALIEELASEKHANS